MVSLVVKDGLRSARRLELVNVEKGRHVCTGQMVAHSRLAVNVCLIVLLEVVEVVWRR